MVVYREAQSNPSTFSQFENMVPRQFTFDPSFHGTCEPVSASTNVTRHPAIEATLQAKTLLKDLVALHSPLARRMCSQPQMPHRAIAKCIYGIWKVCGYQSLQLKSTTQHENIWVHCGLYAMTCHIIHLVPQNSQEAAAGSSGASLIWPLPVSEAWRCTQLGEVVGASATCI